MPMLRNSVLAGAFVASALSAQGACFDALGTGLNVGDDTIVQGQALGFTFTFNGVGYTSICIDSNGSVYLGATTTQASDWTPTEAEFLASTSPRICGMWTDFNCVANGDVYFNAVPAAGSNPAYATVTWSQAYEFTRTTPIDMQIKLDANNVITVAYGASGFQGGSLNTTGIIGATMGAGAPSNQVSFATRPTVIAQNTFAQIVTLPSLAFPASFKMSWTPTLPGYVATDVACAGPASVATLGAGCPAVTGLGAGDDTTHTLPLPFTFPHASGPITTVIASSNGFLTLGTSTTAGTGCCNGDVATLLSGPPRVAALWTDLNANDAGLGGHGEVSTAVEPGSGAFVVTWRDIGEYNFTPTASNNFQIALYPSGDIQIRYLNVAVGGTGRVALAGYSDGNNTADPGPSDLSVAAAPSVNTIYELFTGPTAVDLTGMNFLLIPNGVGGYLFIPGAGSPFSAQGPLVLAAAPAPNSLPQLGTTLILNLSGISAAPQGNVALLFIGFTELNPGVDLGQLLGATGCTAFFAPSPVDLQFLNFTFGAPTTSYSIAVPNNPTLLGGVGIAEAVSDDSSANAFGWKFSNGLRLTVGP